MISVNQWLIHKVKAVRRDRQGQGQDQAENRYHIQDHKAIILKESLEIRRQIKYILEELARKLMDTW